VYVASVAGIFLFVVTVVNVCFLLSLKIKKKTSTPKYTQK
jgi:hypothetical protein